MCRGTFKFSIGQSGSLLRLKDWRALKESFLSPFTPFQSVQWSIMSIDVGSLRWKAGGRVVLSIARLLPGFPESDAVDYQGRSREGNGRDFRCHKMPRDATKIETETETKWDILRLSETTKMRWFEMPYESPLAWSHWFNGSSFKLVHALSQASVDSDLWAFAVVIVTFKCLQFAASLEHTARHERSAGSWEGPGSQPVSVQGRLKEDRY